MARDAHGRFISGSGGGASGVKDIDHGWDRILHEQLGVKVVKVGITGAGAEAVHPDTGITNAQLGAVHEYGATIQHPGGTLFTADEKTGRNVFIAHDDKRPALGATGAHVITIPARSFMRSTMDANHMYAADIDKAVGAVLDGKLHEDRALGLIGMKAASDMQRTIEKGIPVPLAASTIKRKGSSKPLVDHGDLKNSITHAVVDKSTVTKGTT